ncbi:peptidoglycan-binding domain-containing protein [uncultured Hoeflea sp.]|uniref:DUF6636 domain-containing protein n=1 Tax=uncultured Hoeflea sp. TaxID=538666 RepID=UPI00262414F2|nr:peptidoglycan-binding domain-containing protein [uncultured Hoeflea sp.]
MKLRLSLMALLVTGAPALADVWTFETPSQNIQCSVGESPGASDIRCTIIERQGAPALPRPDNCRAGWGHTFEMNDRGLVRMVCEPLDRTKGGQSVADYGVRGEFGGFVCDSSTRGLECVNRDGNGFRLARRSQAILGSAETTPRAAPAPAAPVAELPVKTFEEPARTVEHQRRVEELLDALGFDIGVVDGIADGKTIAAINAFQRTNGLEVLDWIERQHLDLLEARVATLRGRNSGTPAVAPVAPEPDAGIAAPEERPIDLDLLLDMADGVRARVLFDPDPVKQLIAGIHVLGPVGVLAQTEAFETVLRTSIPAAGCVFDQLNVFGYYHVGQHLWTVLWVDRATGRIVDARLSTGFVPKGGQGVTSWYELIDADSTFLESMRQSVSIQLDAFGTIFPVEDCAPVDALETLFAGNRALAEMAAHQQGLPDNAARILTPIRTGIAERYGVARPKRLLLSFFVAYGQDTALAGFVDSGAPTRIFVDRLEQSGADWQSVSSGAGNLIE